MHTPAAAHDVVARRVFDGVTPYHWLVVIIASCGWLFDCMDQRLFILATRAGAHRAARRRPAGCCRTSRRYIGYATTSMILGWATGGIIFGMMSDRLGRVKTMVVDAAGLLGLHRAVWPGDQSGWTSRSIASSSASASAGCSAPRRRWSPRACRGQFRAHGARIAAGAVGGRQHHRLAASACRFRRARRASSAAIAAGACCSSSASCRRCWSCRSSSCSRSRSRGCARRPTRRPASAAKSVGSPLELFRDPRWRAQHDRRACCSASPG